MSRRSRALLTRVPAGVLAVVLASGMTASPVAAAVPRPVFTTGEARAASTSPVVFRPDPTRARAHAAFARFLGTFWDAHRQLFVRASGSALSRTREAAFWWEAQAWETILDAYEANDVLAPRRLVDVVFDARVRRGLDADYNDDLGWWAMAAVRAYRLTGEGRFLSAAVSVADRIWRSWDRSAGGIWWRRSVRDQKNVATNATAAIVSAELFTLTGERRFRARATAIYEWLETHLRRGGVLADRLTANGRVVGPAYTYDFGQYAGAARELAVVTGDTAAAQTAEELAVRAMGLGAAGVLPDEGAGDGGGFKGILVRQVALLATSTGDVRLEQLLEANAAAAWQHRRPDGLSGTSWQRAPGGAAIELLTDVSAVRLFEQLELLRLRQSDIRPRVAFARSRSF